MPGSSASRERLIERVPSLSLKTIVRPTVTIPRAGVVEDLTSHVALFDLGSWGSLVLRRIGTACRRVRNEMAASDVKCSDGEMVAR